MGEMLAVAGTHANALELGTVTTLPAASALFPAPYLFDKRPIQPMVFGSNPVSPYVQVDADLLRGEGDFEVWPLATWNQLVVGVGSIFQQVGELSPFMLGLSVTDGYSSASVTRLITVKSGWRYRARVNLRVTNPNIPLKFFVQNVNTGKWLNTSNEWTATPAFATSWDSPGWTPQVEHAFTVETYDAVRGDTTILRFWLLVEVAGAEPGTAYIDLFEIVPSVELLVVAGHNLDPVHSDYRVIGSEDPTFATSTILAQNIAIRRGAFFKTWAPQAFRYYRVFPNGTKNDDAIGPIYYGDMYLGSFATIEKSMRLGYELKRVPPNVIAEMSSGDVSVVRQAKDAPLSLSTNFDHTNHSGMEHVRDELWGRSEDGATPVIVIPDSDRPDVVMGMLTSQWKVRRAFEMGYKENDLAVTGLPFPILVS